MKPSEITLLLGNFDIAPGVRADLDAALAPHIALEALAEKVAGMVAQLHASRAVGFGNGWISFHFFRRALDNFDVRCTDNAAADLLAAIGYVKHPGLVGGRANQPVRPDNRKPRLYVRPDHYSVQFVRPRDIEAAYERDQGFTPSRNP